MRANDARTSAAATVDPLYASNGVRPDADHYSVGIEQTGGLSWKWTVVHWPAMYRGGNGSVYPPRDWRAEGRAITYTRARRKAEKAVAKRRRALGMQDRKEHFHVVA